MNVRRDFMYICELSGKRQRLFFLSKLYRENYTRKNTSAQSYRCFFFIARFSSQYVTHSNTKNNDITILSTGLVRRVAFWMLCTGTRWFFFRGRNMWIISPLSTREFGRPKKKKKIRFVDVTSRAGYQISVRFPGNVLCGSKVTPKTGALRETYCACRKSYRDRLTRGASERLFFCQCRDLSRLFYSTHIVTYSLIFIVINCTELSKHEAQTKITLIYR